MCKQRYNQTNYKYLFRVSITSKPQRGIRSGKEGKRKGRYWSEIEGKRGVVHSQKVRRRRNETKGRERKE